MHLSSQHQARKNPSRPRILCILTFFFSGAYCINVYVINLVDDIDDLVDDIDDKKLFNQTIKM